MENKFVKTFESYTFAINEAVKMEELVAAIIAGAEDAKDSKDGEEAAKAAAMAAKTAKKEATEITKELKTIAEDQVIDEDALGIAHEIFFKGHSSFPVFIVLASTILASVWGAAKLFARKSRKKEELFTIAYLIANKFEKLKIIVSKDADAKKTIDAKGIAAFEDKEFLEKAVKMSIDELSKNDNYVKFMEAHLENGWKPGDEITSTVKKKK